MAVVIGADFQMFVLWKEARDPFNPSHFTRGKGCSSHVTAVGAPKGGETHHWWTFSVLFSERWNMGLFIYFYFILILQQSKKGLRSELFWPIFFPFWRRPKAAAAQQKDKPVQGDYLQTFWMKDDFKKIKIKEEKCQFVGTEMWKLSSKCSWKLIIIACHKKLLQKMTNGVWQLAVLLE